ncbi:MAG: clostripain-related cysteine peptidase [Ruminococcus sp.]|nr:clostripain-related cysteine peptidase [Ruminococcus sp.]
MKNKIIVLVLLCALAVSLFTGCGNTNINGTVEGRTLFIYMCGSNLETKQGLAGKNIDELLAADTDGLNIVIQTGGAKTWRSHDISESNNQRYEIKDGKLTLLKDLSQENMGEADTLTDFLKWGQKKYPTKNNMLVLWDHGGGSAKGVCFDENYSFDALTLTELKSALKGAKLKNKFDIIGFDACLMASIETAAMVKDYAKYMIASEEIVPAGGWDYKTVAKAFKSGKSEKQIGKQICDSFMKKCKDNEQELFSTLSVFDLSKLKPMIKKFSEAARYLNRVAGTENYFSQVLNAARQSEKFGVDNVFDGSANMVDFIDFNGLVNIKDLFAWNETKKFVVYSVNSGERNNSGVSFFYPLNVEQKEIEEYISLGICKEYNDFLSEYYLNAPDTTLEFNDKGSVTKDGAFRVSLTEDSHKYLASVNYLLMETDKDGKQRIIRSDVDIVNDWKNLIFKSDFKGVVPALKGHRMYSKLHVDREFFLDYECPAIVNGKKTYIRYYYTPKDKSYIIPGICDGFDENGLPINVFGALINGDKIRLATDVSLSGDKINYGKEFVFNEDDNVTKIRLDGKEYQYVFVATDIFGKSYYSDTATFEKQGNIFRATKTEPYTTE